MNKIAPKAVIESLDQEGRGVTHVDGKVIFIEGALTGETVHYQSTRKKPSYEIAHVTEVIKESSQRVRPRCEYFGMCGGCALQHMDIAAQVASKQRILETNLWHIGRVKPEGMLSPVYGPTWGYRHKARLRVRHVPKKNRVLVGFNEKASSFVADMASCQVLPPHLSQLIVPLQELIAKLSVIESLPQIEVAIGEVTTVLVFRILQPLSEEDLPLMKDFSDRHQVQIWTQTKGLDTVKPLYNPGNETLYYTLPEFDLRYPFNPTEFTQVNPDVNRVMVRRAMQLLQPQAHERIADFFCGLGNFTLPIARGGAKVFGLEGSEALVKRAQQSTDLNGLSGKVDFKVADLFDMTPDILASLGYFDKWLIDPPRDGAVELVKSLPDAGGEGGPSRIVYVSCNPATLARDAAVLVQLKGYRMRSCGVLNMFPHTAHVESMALFEK